MTNRNDAEFFLLVLCWPDKILYNFLELVLLTHRGKWSLTRIFKEVLKGVMSMMHHLDTAL